MSEFEFRDPSLRMSTAEGKPVFEMKRKDPEDGEMYYIFKIYEENIAPEKKKLFMKTFENLILPKAAELEIPMYSIDEINERSQEKLNQLVEKEGLEEVLKRQGKQFDVTIEIFDHTTKTLRNLIVGLTIGGSLTTPSP